MLVQMAVTFGLSVLSRALNRKNAPLPPGLRSGQTTSGETTPQTIILGKYATAGNMVCPPMTHGRDGRTANAYLTYVIDLADMPLHSLDAIWIDDERLIPGNLDGEGFRALAGKFAGCARVKFIDGRQTSADPYLMDRYATYPERPWRSDMIGRGVAHAIVEFKYNREVFKAFPKVLFEVTGIALYDPRKDSSAGGSGAHRWGDPTTWEPSENSAVQVYNILRGITLDATTRWGGRIAGSDLPLDNWRAAMNACDVQVDGEPQYRTSYEIKVGPESMGGDAPADMIDELLRGSCAQIMEYGGIWKTRVGGVGLPVMVFTDDDLLITDEHQFTPFLSLAETHNAVHAQYPEPAERWAAKEAPPRYSAEFEALDQGRRLIASVSLPTVPYRRQVQRMMQHMLLEERRMARHDLPVPPDFAVLEPLDAVAWTSARNGYTSKVFEVSGKVDDQRTLLQRISLRERDAADVLWSPGDLLPSSPVPVGTPLPLAEAVPGWAVSGVVVSDDQGRPRRAACQMVWDADQPDVRGVRYEVRAVGRTDLAAQGSTLDVTAGGLRVVDGILPGAAMQARARLVVDRPTRWTDWTDWTAPAVGLIDDDLGAALRGRLDSAQAEAEAAGQAAADANAAAGAALAYTDQEIQQARADLAVDFEAAIAAGGTAATASNAAQAARDAALAAQTSAAGSATAASGHATTAQTRATAAEQSATAAASSAAAANTARSGALAARDQAVAARDTAEGSAASAQNSQQLAAQARADAAGFAAAAGASRTQAQNSASSAANSATTAGTQATDAASSATAANNARIAAEAARDGANSASASAGVARDQAVLARQNAEGSAAAAQEKLVLTAEVSGRDMSVINDTFLISSDWTRSGTAGTLTTPANTVYPVGRDWRFVVTDAQNTGIQIQNSPATIWRGALNADAYAVEVEYTLESGSLSGAGIRLTWNNTGGAVFRTQISLQDATAGDQVTGRTRLARVILRRPSNYSGTFSSHSLMVLANDSAWTPAAKTIRFHRIRIRPATAEELGSGEVEAGVRANILADYLTSAQTNSAIASARTALEAQLGQTNASVTQTNTALADLRGGVASISYLAQAQGAGAAGIEAVSINQNGAVARSALRLRGDDVIAEGTLSTDKLVVGLGRNLLIDPEFCDDLTHYQTFLTNGTTASVRAAGRPWAHPGYPTLELAQYNNVSGDYSDLRFAPVTSQTGGRSAGIPVRAGLYYCASVHLSVHRCEARVFLTWHDSTGAFISAASSPPITASGSDISGPDNWPRHVARGQAPTGAAYASIWIRKYGTTTGGNSFLFVWHPQIEEISSLTQQPSPWSPGGTTLINGGRLIANSVTAQTVETGSFAAAGLALFGGDLKSTNHLPGQRGWRIGNDGSAEFRNLVARDSIQIGAVDTDRITLNGVSVFDVAGSPETLDTGGGDWVTVCSITLPTNGDSQALIGSGSWIFHEDQRGELRWSFEVQVLVNGNLVARFNRQTALYDNSQRVTLSLARPNITGSPVSVVMRLRNFTTNAASPKGIIHVNMWALAAKR